MYIKSSKHAVRAKSNTNPRRRIVAEEEVQDNGGVSVDPEATELVFETQDVAELLAEVTGEDVEAVADENEVTFTIGDTDYTVESEGQEEILETSRKALRGKTAVRANRNATRRPVSASQDTRRSAGGKTVRRVPQR